MAGASAKCHSIWTPWNGWWSPWSPYAFHMEKPGEGKDLPESLFTCHTYSLIFDLGDSFQTKTASIRHLSWASCAGMPV